MGGEDHELGFRCVEEPLEEVRNGDGSVQVAIRLQPYVVGGGGRRCLGAGLGIPGTHRQSSQRQEENHGVMVAGALQFGCCSVL